MSLEPRPLALRRRGQPILVLLAILGGWVGVRAATWDGGWDLSVWPQGGKGEQSSFGLADPMRPAGGERRGANAMILSPSSALRPGKSGLQAMPGAAGHASSQTLPPAATMPGAAWPESLVPAATGLPGPPYTPPYTALLSPGPRSIALLPPRAAPMVEPPSAPAPDRPAGLPHWSADA